MTDTVYYTDGLMEKLQYKPYKEPEFDELKDYLNAEKGE